ncbi:translation initiation factor IF-2-like isoform X2 [Falco biarmicus]|uniref:translation initiation factor IF-2-like isoform X2 n=1 Tax=Falco biarmicus TaxID=345155 RepID=UPI0024BD19DE|nr:translation initiation factor IF-2-like isoform X2 [Falco biarmicus]
MFHLMLVGSIFFIELLQAVLLNHTFHPAVVYVPNIPRGPPGTLIPLTPSLGTCTGVWLSFAGSASPVIPWRQPVSQPAAAERGARPLRPQPNPGCGWPAAAPGSSGGSGVGPRGGGPQATFRSRRGSRRWQCREAAAATGRLPARSCEPSPHGPGAPARCPSRLAARPAGPCSSAATAHCAPPRPAACPCASLPRQRDARPAACTCKCGCGGGGARAAARGEAAGAEVRPPGHQPGGACGARLVVGRRAAGAGREGSTGFSDDREGHTFCIFIWPDNLECKLYGTVPGSPLLQRNGQFCCIAPHDDIINVLLMSWSFTLFQCSLDQSMADGSTCGRLGDDLKNRRHYG